MPRLRGGRPLKIILFGSYARGDWFEDPVGRYFSDYDLLVVVDREELTDLPEFWARTERNCSRSWPRDARSRPGAASSITASRT